MTPDDMEGRLLADAEDMAAQDAGVLGVSKRSRRLNDLAEDLRALLLDYQERGRALEASQSLLRECLGDYGHENFTDRHGMTDRIRATLKGKSHD